MKKIKEFLSSLEIVDNADKKFSTKAFIIFASVLLVGSILCAVIFTVI